MAKECYYFQLIDGKGCFDDSGMKDFAKSVKLDDCGLSYAIVSIMGPQSSGKSTLLNNVFGTNFGVMDATKGKTQTTTGIWLAKDVGIKDSRVEHCTLVMDVEGTDGRERGENDTLFERQSALFALAISDIVLINMWYSDIGRENAANKPLLRTVFQVMTDIFTLRKKTLMFVVRDPSPKMTLKSLETDLLKEINTIWNEVKKPQKYYKKSLSDSFDVKIEVLPNFEREEEKFKQQAEGLRKKLFHSIAEYKHNIPDSGIATYAKNIWQQIVTNKDLGFSSLRSLLASRHCEEIVKESLDLFTKNKDWLWLKKEVQRNEVPNFGKTLTSLVQSCISEYCKKTTDCDESIKNAKRMVLSDKILQESLPCVNKMLSYIESQTLENLKEQLKKSPTKMDEFEEFAKERSQDQMAYFKGKCADFPFAYSVFSSRIEKLESQINLCVEQRKHEVEEEIKNKEVFLAAVIGTSIGSSVGALTSFIPACSIM